MTGTEVLGDQDMSGPVQLFLVLALGCSLVSLVSKPALLCFLCGGGGVIAVLLGVNVVRQDLPVNLMTGGYLGILGFLAVVAEGVLQSVSARRIAEAPELEPQPPSPPSPGPE